MRYRMNNSREFMMKRILGILISIMILFSTSARVFAESVSEDRYSLNSVNSICESEILAKELFSYEWEVYTKEGDNITNAFYHDATSLYNNELYADVLDLFVAYEAYAVKRTIIPDGSRSAEWIYEDVLGYKYVDELNHNFPNNNIFIYEVRLKYQHDYTNGIISNALPPQLLRLSLSYQYGDDPAYVTTSNKSFTISSDKQSVAFQMTMIGVITLVVPEYPQVIVYRYETTEYWTRTI